MKKQATDPAFSEKYCKACSERDVPVSILVEHMLACKGKTPEEQRMLKDQFADEILKKYPKNYKTIVSHISPDAKHQLLVFKSTHGSTGSASVWVKAAGTGEMSSNKEARCLYRYPDFSIDAEWVDNETIRVFATDSHKTKHIYATMNILRD